MAKKKAESPRELMMDKKMGYPERKTEGAEKRAVSKPVKKGK